MQSTVNKYITADMKMADLIFDNPYLLLFMEHFGIGFRVHGKTVLELCTENNIRKEIFLALINMYNGFTTADIENFTKEDLASIIIFLKNSHNYYENEKYPEIRNYIEELYLINNSPEIKLIGKFFDEYFEEVKEHLTYENNVAFPYFNKLLNYNVKNSNEEKFSVKDYSDHHTDIEYKLNDLKELLLKHIPIQNDRIIRRKIIVSLFELEHHLYVHSLIEETILMPLIAKFEKELS